jgi:hypothetical protein
LAAAFVLVTLTGLVVGVVVPRVLNGSISTVAVLVIVGWWLLVVVFALSLCQTAGRADDLADRARDRRRTGEWEWPTK